MNTLAELTAHYAKPLDPHGWRRITKEVCDRRKVAVRDVMGSMKFQELCDARFEIWFRLRNEIKIVGKPVSYPMIGKWFGDRDHTTILHGVQRYRETMG